MAYKVCVVGGFCSNRMMIVAEQVSALLEANQLHCQISVHGIGGQAGFPPRSNLILQLLPAFTEAEAGCPVINIKPLIGNPNHAATVEKILQQVRAGSAG